MRTGLDGVRIVDERMPPMLAARVSWSSFCPLIDIEPALDIDLTLTLDRLAFLIIPPLGSAGWVSWLLKYHFLVLVL